MSGHVVPLPTTCVWCGGVALAETTCPASIPCPRCKARPGSRCRRPSGHAAMSLHRERWETAEATDRLELQRQDLGAELAARLCN